MAITKDQVLQMDWKTIQATIKSPETSAQMQQLLRDREVVSFVSKLMLAAKNEQEAREAELDGQIARVVPPSTEALAAEAEQMAAAPAEPVAPAAPPALPSFEAEDAEWAVQGIRILRDAAGKALRYVQEYQVLGEDERPIGRPTHLEARTLPELMSKQREVHTQATRAFHRLKQQKLTFKQGPKTSLTPEQIAEAAKSALEAKDSSKVTDVIREVIESQYQKRDRELSDKEAFEEGRAISNEFMRRHLYDYNPCEANQKAISEYFAEHNLDFTLDNLEAAFLDLISQEGKLVKVKSFTQTPAVEVANPTPTPAVAATVEPVIPVAEPAAAVPVPVVAQPPASVAPAVTATAPTPAAPNQQPAARRPGVNGSLPPGTFSAERPVVKDAALARKEFLQSVRDMKPDQMRAKLKTDPQFVKQLEAYGIRIR
jgi:hypothetical protein